MKKLAEKRIAQYVEAQFPEIYRSESPQFVDFVKKYYEHLDTDLNLKSRTLPDTRDIDTTHRDYLSHFVEKYMSGLPTNALGDLRFFQKHILDLYRSKGSLEGIKLLFRAVYKDEVKHYLPAKDMLKPSDGKWIQNKYFEVNYKSDLNTYEQKTVVGQKSGATAIVEKIIIHELKDRIVHTMYLSNIVGTFKIAERLSYDGKYSSKNPIILGSMIGVELEAGLPNRKQGERFKVNGPTGQKGLVRISELSRIAETNLTVSLIDGGHGYTLTSNIEIITQPLLAEDDVFLLSEFSEYLDLGNGSGAELAINEIIDVTTVTISTAFIYMYEDDALIDSTFLGKSGLLSESYSQLLTQDSEALIDEQLIVVALNDDTVIGEWESPRDVDVGAISKIELVNPGAGYDDVPVVIITEEFVENLQIPNETGGVWGSDAVVKAFISIGSDYVEGVKVVDSGFGFSKNEKVVISLEEENWIMTQNGFQLTLEDGSFLKYPDIDNTVMNGFAVLGPVGYSAGYWEDSSGMLNEKKYVQDSYYYQDFSYDVISSKPLRKYKRVLKDTFHPTGNELFGTTLITGYPEFSFYPSTVAVGDFAGVEGDLDVNIDYSSYPDLS